MKTEKIKNIIGKMIYYWTISMVFFMYIFTGLICIILYSNNLLPKLVIDVIIYTMSIFMILYGIGFFFTNIKYTPPKKKNEKEN